MAQAIVTLTDGQVVIVSYGLYGDPTNCGYKNVANLTIHYKDLIGQEADYYAVPVDLARVIFKSVHNHLAQNIGVKRYVMSGIVSTIPKKAHSGELPPSTYHFIKYNRLSMSKPVIGSHARPGYVYHTVLAWFDHGQVSEFTKRDQATLKLIKEIKYG